MDKRGGEGNIPGDLDQLNDSRLGGRLDGVDLLACLSDAERRALERRCTWREFSNGEQILDRNSGSRDVYFVTSGSCEIVNYSLTGREIAFATITEGAYFGELSAIDGEPRSASVVAASACLIASLAPDDFLDLLKQHPETALTVLGGLARVIRICDDRIMDLSTLGAVQRVYVELLRRATPDPVAANSWIIYPKPTQVEIAARASTTRETVARVMSQLSQSGLLARKGKTLYLRDRDRLETLVERLATPSSDGLSR